MFDFDQTSIVHDISQALWVYQIEYLRFADAPIHNFLDGVPTPESLMPGISVTVQMQKPPHHVPADGELVTALLSAYEEETGLEGKPMSTGGGTYAKVLKQGVAFGALFPDDEDLAHQADEYEDIDRLMLATKIYANALIRLAGE